MPIEIAEKLKKYVKLTEDGEKIDKLVCPVPGCTYATGLGPGALRMHMLMSGDPDVPTRHEQAHEDYLKTEGNGLSKADVVYLRSLMPA